MKWSYLKSTVVSEQGSGSHTDGGNASPNTQDMQSEANMQAKESVKSTAVDFDHTTSHSPGDVQGMIQFLCIPV